MSGCAQPAMVLKAGQAASRQRRFCARMSSWRADLHRSCKWLDCFCQASPVLGEEPLLGACLRELTAQLGHPCRPQPDEPGPRRRFDADSESEAVKQVRCMPPEPLAHRAPAWDAEYPNTNFDKRTLPVCRKPLPLTETLRADSSLLSRLCPETRKQIAPVYSPRNPRSLLPFPSLSFPSQAPVARQVSPLPPARIRDWFRDLVEGTQLHLKERSISLDHLDRERGPRPSTPGTRDEHPEARHLDGPTISERRLLELSAESGLSDARAAQTTRPQSPDRVRRDQSQFRGSPDLRRPIQELPNDLESNHESPSFSGQTEEAERQWSSEHSPLGTDSGSRLPSSGSVAPTELAVSAVSPSPEISSQAFRSPLPLSATGMFRHSRIDSAAAQEEDMAVLADKIKRILNDEARRFGIDV